MADEPHSTPAGAASRLHLKVVAGPATGQALTVNGGPIVMGRSGEGPLRLGGDPELSREHARVSTLEGAVEGDRLLIEDLGSTNGTFVNGVAVTKPTVLKPGDAIWIGTTTLLVQDERQPASAITPAEPPPPTPQGGFLARIADVADRHPKRILAALAVFFVLSLALGGPVAGTLSDERSFDDVNSESIKAEDRLAAAGDEVPSPRAIVLVRAGQDVESSAVRREVDRLTREIRKEKDISNVLTAFNVDPETRPFFISRDRTQTYLAVFFKDVDEKKRQEVAVRLQDKLEDSPRIQFGGQAIVSDQLSKQIEEDLAKAESLAFPILFLVSIIVFRGVVAALLPMLVGVLTTFGTFLALRLVTTVYDVNVYALNMVIGLGLGLAIDYTLFLVMRYREELARVGRGASATHRVVSREASRPGQPGFVGSDAEALRRTMLTAGRTILFSAATVAVAIATLVVFPQPFLRSMGIGGAACALVAMAVSLVAIPALLGILGPRVNSLAPAGWKRATERTAAQERSGPWYRFSQWVMRHPGAVAGVATALLLCVAVSFLRVDATGVNAQTAPEGLGARQVAEDIQEGFQVEPSAQLQLAIEAPANAGPELERYRRQIEEIPEVAAVFRPEKLEGDVWSMGVQPWGDGLAEGTIDIVEQIRDGPQPFATEVTGEAAYFVDQEDSMLSRLPIAVGLLVLTTLVLLFLMTGSVILPLKSVLMNLLTISFTLGLLVLIFQDGRFENLLDFESQGALNHAQPILIAAIAFGLSTDYAVFLLGRISEARTRGADDRESVAIGLERTGRIVTQAALLFCIAIGAFATSEVIFIKQLGVGTAAAVIIDATIIRALLVPSLMAMLGRRNWWSPRPLRRLHNRFGLSEG